MSAPCTGASVFTQLAIATAMLVGSMYAAAVLNAISARIVARRPLHLTDAITRPLRSAASLLLQTPSTTERPDAPAWVLAPALLGAMAFAATAAIPFTPDAPVVDSGIVFFGALMAMVMVAVFLHGWSANSLLPLVGGYRFIAAALSYEMPLALVLIAAAIPAESLSAGAIVQSQHTWWNVVRQPLGLPIYMVAIAGLSFWGPLAFPDARDIAGGTTVERSGVTLLLWKVARFAVLAASSAMGAATFLGGPGGPWLPPVAWMAVKTLALITVIVTAGHRIARVRLERFIVLAWTVLIPLALVDVFGAGIVTMLGQRR